MKMKCWSHLFSYNIWPVRFLGDITPNFLCCSSVQSLAGSRWKHSIDYSRFPEISENDLVEQFIKGHGPGGSNVNKTSNCVLLKHLPTGIVIKCHESRLLQKNREKAREILRLKVDDHLNGEMSISAQKKRIDQEKALSQKLKAEKLRAMKKAFKENWE